MIEVNNLVKKYDGKIVLDNISFNIENSKIVAIIGESGSGKSTIAKLLMGIEKKTSGNIYIFNKKIEDYSKKELSKKIGIVFQEYSTSLNPKMNILQILSESFIINNVKVNKNKIEEVLKITKLDYLNLDRNVLNLSGGEKQRLSIARTLILNPDIIIFDEPTSSLDLNISFEIVDIIKKLNEEYFKTIIFITHEIDFLKILTKDIIVLENGKITQRGNIFLK